MRKKSFRKSKAIAIIGLIAFVFSLFLIVIAAQQKQQTRTHAAATGPLKVHPANPRYFTDGTGRAIYLTGSHTWDNLQDSGSYPVTFDYEAYLNLMTTHNHNFIRLWHHETHTDEYYEYEPLPYVKTSSGK